MSGQIKTPTNQKLLTNVAVVRMKRNGKRFEIACYKNKVMNWRNKTEKNIDEVLQTESVFVNVSKGQLAKKEDLLAAFDTDNSLEICKIILEKGEMQVSEKERQVTSEAGFKELATLVANMCVNPDTQRPYSAAVIEKALKDNHFNIKSNRSTKQHALEAVRKLRETMSIDRAKMRVRITVPSKNARNLHPKLKENFETVEDEDWDKGNLTMVGLIDPGSYKTMMDIVAVDKKSEVELLSLKVINDGEIKIA